jgi:hypothetical protein
LVSVGNIHIAVRPSLHIPIYPEAHGKNEDEEDGHEFGECLLPAIVQGTVVYIIEKQRGQRIEKV